MDQFLNEVLAGDYGNDTEDRLTQIFAASFNTSSLFRRTACGFFGISRSGAQKCSTQISKYNARNERCLLDMVVFSKSNPVLIIENKVDAPLENRQLTKYNSILEYRGVRRAAITRAYQLDGAWTSRWEIHYWSDFHRHLIAIAEKDFVVSNFISRLEYLEMQRPTIIRRADLKMLAKAFYHIRYNQQRPELRLDLPVFEAIENYKTMLQEIQKKVVKDDVLRKRIGRNVRCNPWLSYWWEKKPGERMLWIGWEVDLAKTYRGIESIGTALHFYKVPDKYRLRAYLKDGDGNYAAPTKDYPGKDLVYDEYEEMVLRFWRRRLR